MGIVAEVFDFAHRYGSSFSVARFFPVGKLRDLPNLSFVEQADPFFELMISFFLRRIDGFGQYAWVLDLQPGNLHLHRQADRPDLSAHLQGCIAKETVYLSRIQLPKTRKMLANYARMRKLNEELLEINIAIFKQQSKL
jgi:hypothetical protein